MYKEAVGVRHNEIYSYVVNSNAAVWHGFNKQGDKEKQQQGDISGRLEDMEGKEGDTK